MVDVVVVGAGFAGGWPRHANWSDSGTTSSSSKVATGWAAGPTPGGTGRNSGGSGRHLRRADPGRGAGVGRRTGGCERVPTYGRGKNLIRWRGRVRSYRSTIPRLSILELVDVSRIQWRFDRISRKVPVAEPWTSPIAADLDAISLDQWLRSVHAGASTRDLMAIMARVTWGV